MRIRPALFLAASLFLPIATAQNASPGPSKEATFQWLTDKLPLAGYSFGLTKQFPNMLAAITQSMRVVSASFRGCDFTIIFRVETGGSATDGKTVFDYTYQGAISAISGIQVMPPVNPAESLFRDGYSSPNGALPTNYPLRLVGRFSVETSQGRAPASAIVLPFSDPDLRRRIQNALSHATVLCAAVKEPF